MLSGFSRVWLFSILWIVVRKGPLSMGFSRQENWSGLPCPPPGDLPDPGIQPTSAAPALKADLPSHQDIVAGGYNLHCGSGWSVLWRQRKQGRNVQTGAVWSGLVLEKFMEKGCINKDLKEVKKIHLNIWEEYECIFGGDDIFVNTTSINSQIRCI